jgi:hypothetical protein
VPGPAIVTLGKCRCSIKDLACPVAVREQFWQRLADVLAEQEFPVKITAPAAQGWTQITGTVVACAGLGLLRDGFRRSDQGAGGGTTARSAFWKSRVRARG